MASLHLKLEQLKKNRLNGLQKGLLKAGLHLQGLSQQIVPVEHGVLKASAQTRLVEDQLTNPTVIVSYTAPYASYVHEIPPPGVTHGAEYNTKHAAEIAAGVDFARGPNQTYKFLERPLRENVEELKKMVRTEVSAELFNE